MTEDKIKQTSKIAEFAKNMAKQSNYPKELEDHIVATCMVVVAEATKELQEENNELKGKLVLNDMVLTDKTKRIKELEDKLTEKVTLESLDVVSGKIKQLEKENKYYRNRCKDCALELSRGKLKDLEKENEELKLKLEALEGQTPWKDIKDKSELIKENAELENKIRFMGKQIDSLKAIARFDQFTKTKEIILRLYNAGRDVLMCRTEEKAYDNLSNAINDRSIEQFIKETK